MPLVPQDLSKMMQDKLKAPGGIKFVDNVSSRSNELSNLIQTKLKSSGALLANAGNETALKKVCDAIAQAVIEQTPLEKVCDSLAQAVVLYMQQNTQVVIDKIVTACPAGAGSGTGTGTIT